MNSSVATFQLADIALRVASDDPRFMAYASTFLDAFTEKETEHELFVEMVYADGSDKDKEIPQYVWGSDAVSFERGKSFLAHSAASIWCSVEKSGSPTMGGITVRSSWRPTRARRLNALLRARQGSANQRYMTAIRHALFQPATALLLQRRSMITLHASAVERSGKAVVFAGLNGSGKSGLALDLVLGGRFRFMADNYALIDSNDSTVYACPEPIRVAGSEEERASKAFEGDLQAFGKIQMRPKESLVCKQAKVAAIIHVTIGESFSVRKLEPADFGARMEAVHRFLGETAEYSWFQLYSFWQLGIDLGALAAAARCQLFRLVPCYEMTIPHTPDYNNRYTDATSWIDELTEPSE